MEKRMFICWLFCSAVVMAQMGVAGPPPRRLMQMQIVELGLTGTNICISFNQEMKNVTVRVFNNGTEIRHQILNTVGGSEVIVPAKPGIYVIQVINSERILVREWEIEV